MISFDRIVRILLGDMARGRYQLLDHSRIRGSLIGGHFARAWAVFEGTGEEVAGGRQIPLLRSHHIDDLAVLVDRTIQIHPVPGDLHICLVHEPAISRDMPTGTCRIDQQRGEPLHPPIDRHVIHRDAPFRQQLLHVAIGLRTADTIAPPP
jgi:hypothetical protein